MKLYSASYGCQMNVADSEEMSRPFTQKGFNFTDDPDQADAIMINTCTVRQHAEDKAISYIGSLKKWKEKNSNRLLIVTGCAAERTKEHLQKRFPYIDLVAGAKSIESFPQLIDEALKEKFNWTSDNQSFQNFSLPDSQLATRSSASGAPSAASSANGRNSQLSSAPGLGYVTTMRGCNYTCAYCIVPFVRGREIYRPPETIIKEVHEHLRQGAQEIMLLGQTVNSYRCKPTNTSSMKVQNKIEDFADLIKSLGNIPELKRLRFMSPHPHYFNDKLIETMAQTPAICEHLHLPLQSGSDQMLKLMRRNYTSLEYKNIIHRLRTAMPNIALTTDIIVGFPGETEDDFKASLDMIEELGFNLVYCFKFSPRQGTDAALLNEQLSEEVKENRHQRLLEVVENVGKNNARSALGKKMEILWETPTYGKSRNFYNVTLSSPQTATPGKTSSVIIEGVKNRKLLARLVA